MKVILLFIFAVLISATSAYSQWVIVDSTSGPINDIFFSTPNRGFVAYANGILKTEDGGHSWTSVHSVPTFGRDIYKVKHAGGSVYLAVGDDGMFYKSVDNGNTWVEISTGFSQHQIMDFAIINSDTIYCGYYKPTFFQNGFLKSYDGGETWSYNPTSFNYGGITAIHFFDSRNGVVVGGSIGYQINKGFIARTSDGGNTWTYKVQDPEPQFLAVDFSGDFGLAAGRSNLLYKTNDRGIIWTKVNVEPSHIYLDFKEIKILSLNNFAAAGYRPFQGQSAFIGQSFNDGVNWSYSTFTNTNGFSAIGFSSSGVYTGGGSSKIYKGNFTLTNISSQTGEMNSYSLAQNYPNPFNPSTSINFSMTAKGFASLKVYDVTGREVAELVNSELPAGTHSLSFDASGLNSGVYFYTLRTENFTETKKMLLIK